MIAQAALLPPSKGQAARLQDPVAALKEALMSNTLKQANKVIKMTIPRTIMKAVVAAKAIKAPIDNLLKEPLSIKACVSLN